MHGAGSALLGMLQTFIKGIFGHIASVFRQAMGGNHRTVEDFLIDPECEELVGFLIWSIF